MSEQDARQHPENHKRHSQDRPVAVVTGGRQGLGLAAAQALAVEGFDLVIIDLQPDDDGVTDLRHRLSKAGAATAYVQADISDIDSFKELVDVIWQAFGRVDCLVDKAGIAARPLTDVLDLTAEAFDRVMQINLRGTFFLTQAIANRMISVPDAGNYRSIIVVTSISAELASLERAQYCISKAALSMMSKLFAVRLASENIFVHEVRPGFIETAMTASAGAPALDQWITSGRVPVPRWGQPSDVGQAIATLASGRLPYLTGQPIWVSGGLNIPLSP
ncbi:3-ketoacyl-ACP reductase [Arthrobacter sp. StoSoilA2]|uniref:3-ketoacyl-ACP reductase n=1 Tax=Arthrobacter sp. StoSoilA2 TaxID=2830990 RepID=UPI001CC75E01|nr:3-ketoacyl-ACP reductase [Arthrobacter sp. StoSoilA2]BCW35863.1 3-ketoacyl-ACP reductase [Arthrobacter sp. StoSoilA2]